MGKRSAGAGIRDRYSLKAEIGLDIFERISPLSKIYHLPLILKYSRAVSGV